MSKLSAKQKKLGKLYGNDPAGWSKHKNGGGWKYETATVESSVWLSENAQISGNARIWGDAQISGNARIWGDAWIWGDAQISGDAWIWGDAQISGNARIWGDAWIWGNAQISGDAWIWGDAQISGNAWNEPVLFVQHRFCMNLSAKDTLRIGCEHQTIAEWEKNGEKIARKHGELDWYKTFAKPLIPYFEAENKRLFGKAKEQK